MLRVLVVVAGLAGVLVSCGAPGAFVIPRLWHPPHVGDLVVLAERGRVVAVLPSGVVRIQVRVRLTGDLATDVVTLDVDPGLLRVVRR